MDELRINRIYDQGGLYGLECRGMMVEMDIFDEEPPPKRESMAYELLMHILFNEKDGKA